MLYNPWLLAPAAAVARKAGVRIAAWRIGFFGETSDSSGTAADVVGIVHASRGHVR
jgi:hypothetical protein